MRLRKWDLLGNDQNSKQSDVTTRSERRRKPAELTLSCPQWVGFRSHFGLSCLFLPSLKVAWLKPFDRRPNLLVPSSCLLTGQSTSTQFRLVSRTPLFDPSNVVVIEPVLISAAAIVPCPLSVREKIKPLMCTRSSSKAALFQRLNYQLLLPQFDRQTLNKSGELVLKWVQGVKIMHHHRRSQTFIKQMTP